MLYYTPLIEEFHVGFEYEESDYELQIIKSKKVNSISILNKIGKLLKDFKGSPFEEQPILVKYLDKEDIKTLGFKFSFKEINDFYILDTGENNIDFGGWYSNTIRLNHSAKCKWLKLEAKNKFDKYITLFQGYIKNKSELKDILNKVGYENSRF